MSLILQIETSTISCSVALSESGELLAYQELNERNAHASNLTVFIEEVLQAADKKISDLAAVAVSKGPGSYTGLRIGVSAAKGLCYALDIPLIAVGTLKAMAARMAAEYKQADLFCPLIDARRMEVYTAVYDSELNERLPVEAKIIDENAFSDLLQESRILFFGDGAAKCASLLEAHPNAEVLNSFVNSARDMTQLAWEKFKLGQFEDTAYFEPYYLKDFVAGKPAG